MFESSIGSLQSLNWILIAFLKKTKKTPKNQTFNYIPVQGPLDVTSWWDRQLHLEPNIMTGSDLSDGQQRTSGCIPYL